MKVHYELVHLKLKNFECEECGMKFFRKYHLDLHRDSKHKDYKDRPFTCHFQDCGRKFVILRRFN